MANLTLTNWRTHSRTMVNSVSATQYAESRVDLAIKLAAGEFIRRTKIDIESDETVVTVAGSSAVVFTGIAGFLPGRLMYLEIEDSDGDWQPLKVHSAATVNRELRASSSTSLPRMLAWVGTAARVAPLPDAVYSIRTVFRKPLVTTGWVIGSTVANPVTASTISFAAASGGSQVISDSGSGFGSIVVGHQVTISGAVDSANNGTFLVTASAAGSITVANAAGVVRAAGASITITSEDPTINIDEEYAYQIMQWGVAAHLLYNDPSSRLRSPEWGAFLDFINEVKRDGRPPVGTHKLPTPGLLRG